MEAGGERAASGRRAGGERAASGLLSRRFRLVPLWHQLASWARDHVPSS